MLNRKCNVTLDDDNKKKVTLVQDPTNDFSIIPSWNKEFVCLIGLENVVQFRLDWLDKAVYAASNQPRTSGKPRKFRKYPYTCAKCDTDVSCTWKRDVDSSILCDSCFRGHWRKAHWLSREPSETVIESIFSNSSSQPVWKKPHAIKEGVFPVQHSSHSIHQHCDQEVPKNSLCPCFRLDPDSPCYCSSLFSSGLSSSPPGFYSDASSQ